MFDSMISPPAECEAIWQRTMLMDNFDPEALEHERTRNVQPAYGLTLVADYPLCAELLTGIDRLRRACRRVLGAGVELYPDDHLHLTIYSLMRSRPKPLPEKELSSIWSRWLPQLKQAVKESPSLAVPLQGLAVTGNGAVLVCGKAVDGLRQLQSRLSLLPGVAAPRDVPLHITIGQVKRPCGTAEVFAEAMSALRRWATEPVGTLRFDRLHLLYYSSRLLDLIIKSEVIPGS